MLKKITIIAGGKGSAKSVSALKPYRDEFVLSVVVPMSDSNGSSGILRREFGALPPGDILRATLALSPIEYSILKQIFHTVRFDHAGKLDQHNLGNLFLTFATEYAGNFLDALAALHQAVGAIGTAYPATLEPSDLVVELSDGTVIAGEKAIDRPIYDRALRITRAWLEPSPKISDGARVAIEEADVILFGPGSLYTSVIAALLVDGMKEAIGKSHALLVDVAGNAYETIGETGPTSLSECAHALDAYLPRPTDVVLYNNHVLTRNELTEYAARQWSLLTLDPEALSDRRVVGVDFEKSGGGLDAAKLGQALHALFSVL